MSNNEILKKNNEKAENFDEIKKSSKPTGISVIVREILKDKFLKIITNTLFKFISVIPLKIDI